MEQAEYTSLTSIKDIASIVAVVIGAGSLAFTARNTRRGYLADRARFCLDLHDHFTKYHDETRRLLRDKSWSGPNDDEWPQVVAYMGLFE